MPTKTRAFARAIRAGLICSASCVHAASPYVAWERVPAPQAYYSYAPTAVPDASGDIVVAGGAQNPSTACISKVAGSDGHVLWETQCADSIQIWGIAIDPQGNALTVGNDLEPNLGPARVAKYSGASGAMLWEVYVPNTYAGWNIAADAEGNAYVLAPNGSGNYRPTTLVKVSPSGSILWRSDAGLNVLQFAVDSKGHVVVAGLNRAPAWTVIKFGLDGIPIWTRSRTEPTSSPYAIAVDPISDDVVVAGAARADLYGHSNANATVKYASSDGSQVWERLGSTGSTGGEYSAIAVSRRGDVAVTGFQDRSASTLVYRGSDGATKWILSPPPPASGHDAGSDVVFDLAGDMLVAVTTGDSSSILTTKYSGADGSELWSLRVRRQNSSAADRIVPVRDGIIANGYYSYDDGREDYNYPSYRYLAKYVAPRDHLNAQALWWASPAGSESGWGLNMTHQGDTLFVTWFTYDDDGKPAWFVMPDMLNQYAETYSGAAYRTTGPVFSATPFVPSQVKADWAGQATVQIVDAQSATFEYQPGSGATIKKNLVRQAFAQPPECSMSAAPGTNYQALWWADPPGSESGWGLNLAHQGDILFLTWFTYDVSHRGIWYFGSELRKTGPNAYSGALYRTTGPSYRSMVFDPALVKVFPVGTATFMFTAFDRGTFSYTVDGVSQSKAITRQLFGTPATVCN